MIDVTVAMRYYTQKGRLRLPKSKKSALFAFCDVASPSSSCKLLIFHREGENQQLVGRLFDDFSAVDIRSE